MTSSSAVAILLGVLGFLISVLASACWTGLGRIVLRRWSADFHTAAQIGIAGLFSLGAVATLTLFTGLISTTLAIWFGVGLAVAGIFGHVKAGPLKPEWPKGLEWIFFCACLLAMILSLCGVLAPSNVMDWDTLAYHLAVPKLWLEAGHIYSVPYIHHSNFPQSVDNLYLFGLYWGGQQGAKAFSWMILAFGLKAAYGIAKQEYGGAAGWWACLGLISVPLVLWEAGTAYIDVSHGLFAGLGIYFAAKLLASPGERRYLWLGAIFLSLAAGSKYTGLQTIFVASAALGLGSLGLKRVGKGIGAAFALGFLALALASPWYVRNVIWKGNPVYPFFYSRLGGKDWGERQATIYTHEQNTFGVGRLPVDAAHPDAANNPLDPTRVGHAILGLAYQPGRYVNPGQTIGAGTPLGAFGAVLLAGMLAWMFSGKARAMEYGLLGGSMLTFLIWFALSEQSRYVLCLALPLAILLAGGVVRLRAGPLLAGLAALQTAYCLWLVDTQLATPEMPVAIGMVSAVDYQKQTIPFYEGAQAINKLGPKSETALYDEVFGYLLDVPYFWANPGHTTIIDYDAMRDGEDYVDAMKKLGFTNVYVNVRPVGSPPDASKRWLAATGFFQDPLAGVQSFGHSPQPYTPEEVKSLGFEGKFKYLTADAIAKGLLKPIAGNGRWFLFKIE